METPDGPPAAASAGTVGVRELRQNLSVYLERVKRGEVLTVTEHGRPVARLGPDIPDRADVLDRLIADGRATRARQDHRDLALPPAAPGRSLGDILREMRDEDDR
jgi:prevent-host-death family protein